MDHTQSAHVIERLLDEMCASAQSLQKRLVAEDEALSADEILSLEDIVAQKQTDVQTLAALEMQFRRALQAAGYERSDDISALIKQRFGPNSSVISRWLDLEALLRDCQSRNRENAVRVSAALRHSQQTLHLLHSLVGKTATQLYDPSGQKESQRHSQEIAKA